ncbi:hypothetical protein BC828DRAFT_388557 [Blastocladiella britannica]|nr:hypothetical protein BC828DRAFT_388557 [Blastocladiella britannica]
MLTTTTARRSVLTARRLFASESSSSSGSGSGSGSGSTPDRTAFWAGVRGTISAAIKPASSSSSPSSSSSASDGATAPEGSSVGRSYARRRPFGNALASSSSSQQSSSSSSYSEESRGPRTPYNNASSSKKPAFTRRSPLASSGPTRPQPFIFETHMPPTLADIMANRASASSQSKLNGYIPALSGPGNRYARDPRAWQRSAASEVTTRAKVRAIYQYVGGDYSTEAIAVDMAAAEAAGVPLDTVTGLVRVLNANGSYKAKEKRKVVAAVMDAVSGGKVGPGAVRPAFMPRA